MKYELAAALVAATGVLADIDAKNPPGYGPAGYGGKKHKHKASTTTITSNTCASEQPQTMITVTDGTTVYYCPECEGMGPTPLYTTTYTTVYQSLCPTGIVPMTYTVTESCTGSGRTWTPGPSHIPQGFTVTTKMCSVCEATPTAVTITEPCGCEAHEGTPGPAPPAPMMPTAPASAPMGGSGGAPASPAPAPMGSPAPAECNGEECGGSASGSSPGGAPAAGSSPQAPPYPTPVKPGRMMASASMGTGVAPMMPTTLPTAPITPAPSTPENAASGIAVVSSALAAVIVAALALAL